MYQGALQKIESIEGAQVDAELLNNIGCLHYQARSYAEASAVFARAERDCREQLQSTDLSQVTTGLAEDDGSLGADPTSHGPVLIFSGGTVLL